MQNSTEINSAKKMENQDKIFNQIKTAAVNAETKDFPSLENVWSRVEVKLDKKILKKENTLWKKIAIAASILLFITLGFQYFTTENKLVIPKNDTVITNKNKAIAPIKNENNIEPQLTNPVIKENAHQILEKQIATHNQIVINNDSKIANEKNEGYIKYDTVSTNNLYKSNLSPKSSGTVYKDVEMLITRNKEEDAQQDKFKKSAPLVVIDKSTSEQNLSKIDAEEIESIELLPDPLYIINGVNYTEKELFGANPTSPYAPLNNLIIENISVLKKEEAIPIYGEKGKKGVVIITTKTGKPSFKKP